MTLIPILFDLALWCPSMKIAWVKLEGIKQGFLINFELKIIAR